MRTNKRRGDHDSLLRAVEIADDNEKISLILMDIDLGKGIDGPEAARQGQVANFELQVTRRDGTPAWASFSARLYPEGFLEGAVLDSK